MSLPCAPADGVKLGGIVVETTVRFEAPKSAQDDNAAVEAAHEAVGTSAAFAKAWERFQCLTAARLKSATGAAYATPLHVVSPTECFYLQVGTPDDWLRDLVCVNTLDRIIILPASAPVLLMLLCSF